MLKQPKVSVLLAIYNTPIEFVKRAINSVLLQNMNDFELIIIDDGNDETFGHELLNFTELFPTIISYIYHPNCGQAESINRGIIKSSGQFITVIDADDEFKTNHLSSCLEQMNYADLIASTTQTVVNNDADYYIPDRLDKSKEIHVDDCILFATLFGKKEVFINNPFFSMYGSDANFYERVGKKYVVKKVDLRTYIYYRNNPNSTCTLLKNSLSLN